MQERSDVGYHNDITLALHFCSSASMICQTVLSQLVPPYLQMMTNLSCKELNPNEIQTKLNKDLDNVHQWLTLNITKTEFMIIGSRYRLDLINESPISYT